MMVQPVYDVVAAYPKEGLTDLLILLYTHTQLSFAFRLSSLVPIVLHLDLRREMCTSRSIIRLTLATEGTIFPTLDI